MRGIVPLVHQIEQIATTHFVGMLVIDELQHLRVAKTGGKENMRGRIRYSGIADHAPVRALLANCLIAR